MNNSKDILYNIIREAIKDAIADNTVQIRKFVLKNSDDKKIITDNIDIIWSILQSAYQTIGGFKGYQSAKDMLKRNNEMWLEYYNSQIVAVAVFNNYLGGNKLIGIGAISGELHDKGSICVKQMINKSIQQFDNWYWVEVSGRIEYLYEHMNGYPIPNIYAEHILRKEVILSEDGLHYNRIIGNSDEPLTKVIYGFKDKKLFDKIERECFDRHIRFMDRLKRGEITEWNLKDDKDRVDQIKAIIDYYYSMYYENEIHEFPRVMYQELSSYVFLLRKLYQDGACNGDEWLEQVIPICIENGTEILTYATIYELHKF